MYIKETNYVMKYGIEEELVEDIHNIRELGE